MASIIVTAEQSANVMSFLGSSWIEAGLVLLAVIFFLELRSRRNKPHLPPGPTPYPVIGNLPQLSHVIYRDFENLGKKHGPFMMLQMGAVPVLVVQSAEFAKEITKTYDQVFANRPQDLVCVKFLLFEGDDVGFAPIGRHWRQLRKLLAVDLFLPKRLNTFKEQRLEEISATMRDLLNGSQNGKTVNIGYQMYTLMYNVVTRMVAGKTFYGANSAPSEESEKFKSLMVDYFALFNGFNVVDWFPYMRVFGDFQGAEKKMKKVAVRFETFLQDCIDEHREKNKKGVESGKIKDFVDLLLEIPPDEETGQPFGDRNMRIMMQASFIAGTETTSSALQWALSELIRHPDLLKRLQDEVDSVVGKDRMVTEEDIPQMKLLGAVAKETLRLHPPGPFLLPRQPIQDIKVAGYDIPSNTRVFISIWAIGKDPSVWDNPLKFMPERFLEKPRDFNGSHYEFLPFGSGRRICPGINLGLLMLHLQLAHLVHLCDHSLPAGMRPEDIDMSEAPGFNLPKKVPLEAICTPRLAPEFYMRHLKIKV